MMKRDAQLKTTGNEQQAPSQYRQVFQDFEDISPAPFALPSTLFATLSPDMKTPFLKLQHNI